MPSYPLIRQDGGNYHIRLRPLKRRTTEASRQGTPWPLPRSGPWGRAILRDGRRSSRITAALRSWC